MDGSEPGYETRNRPAVATVTKPEAPVQLAFFEGQLEGELCSVERGEQEEESVVRQEGRAEDKGEIRDVERVPHETVGSLHDEPLRHPILLSPRPGREERSR